MMRAFATRCAASLASIASMRPKIEPDDPSLRMYDEAARELLVALELVGVPQACFDQTSATLDEFVPTAALKIIHQYAQVVPDYQRRPGRDECIRCGGQVRGKIMLDPDLPEHFCQNYPRMCWCLECAGLVHARLREATRKFPTHIPYLSRLFGSHLAVVGVHGGKIIALGQLIDVPYKQGYEQVAHFCGVEAVLQPGDEVALGRWCEHFPELPVVFAVPFWVALQGLAAVFLAGGPFAVERPRIPREAKCTRINNNAG